MRSIGLEFLYESIYEYIFVYILYVFWYFIEVIYSFRYWGFVVSEVKIIRFGERVFIEADAV